MEVMKLIVSAITPIIIFVLGIILLRKIEGIKAEVTKHSDFTSKWASEFWTTCQEFMKVTERYMAILNYLQSLSDPNDDIGKKYQKECNEFNVKLSELELRIRRFVGFSPTNANGVKTLADKILSILTSMLNTRKGNLDDLCSQVDNFNRATKKAHAEMMGIKNAK